jgi:MFS superfamily sulfate permease-like transporter
VLDAAGARVRIYELQGDLSFAAVEALVRRIVDARPEIAVVDLRRTARIEACAPALLASLVADLERVGKRLVVVAARDQGGLLRQLQELLTDGTALKTFSDLTPRSSGETEVLGGRCGLPTAAARRARRLPRPRRGGAPHARVVRRVAALRDGDTTSGRATRRTRCSCS